MVRIEPGQLHLLSDVWLISFLGSSEHNLVIGLLFTMCMDIITYLFSTGGSSLFVITPCILSTSSSLCSDSVFGMTSLQYVGFSFSMGLSLSSRAWLKINMVFCSRNLILTFSMCNS